MAPRGRFITLEGGDGAGKSTQAAHLAQFLEDRGIRCLRTREVGGAPGAEAIRKLWLMQAQGFWDPVCELLLIMAARREHLTRTIWPAMEEGMWIICDRYVDSTRAYQGVGLGLGIEKVDALYAQIAGDFWPDLTLLLDLPVEEGRSRRTAREGESDRYEVQSNAFHNKLRHAFLDLAAREPARFAIIDAGLPAEQVSKKVEDAMFGRFKFLPV